MAACINNHESLVYELIKRGADMELKTKGKTALHYACLLGHVTCAKHLIDAGANLTTRVDVDDSDYTECDGMAPLEIVMDKAIISRDPLKARMLEIERLLRNPTISQTEAEDEGFRQTIKYWNEVDPDQYQG